MHSLRSLRAPQPRMHINVVIPATMYVAIVAIGACCTQNDLGVVGTMPVGSPNLMVV